MGDAAIALIGAPFGRGAPRAGAQMGPEALRVAGLAQSLARAGREARDLGDLAPTTGSARGAALAGVEAGPETAAWIRAAAETVAASLGRGETPVLLGGDHSLGAGGALGAAAHWAEEGRPLFTLWIDAHADFNTPDTSPSGATHGMALAAACGVPGLEPLLAGSPSARLAPRDTLLLGLRSVDFGEDQLLRRHGVRLAPMSLLRTRGVEAPLRDFLDRVSAEDGVLHVSFDIDALDPTVAPGVGTPEPGGLSEAEARRVAALLQQSGRVGSIDLVELNPFYDDRGRSARLMVDLAAQLLAAPAQPLEDDDA